MEIPRIEIPQIQIKEIYIPKIKTWEQLPTTLDIIDKPRLDYPVVDYPTFKALDYLPDKFIKANPVKQPNQQQPNLPEPPEFKPIVKKDKKFFIKMKILDCISRSTLMGLFGNRPNICTGGNT